jgi:glycosyltransferase involved in cell wall biosynthesis
VRIHYDHQVFSLQSTGGNTRYHFELMREFVRYPDVETDLFLGLYPFKDVGAPSFRLPLAKGWDTSMSPGPTRYGINDVLNTAFALRRGRYDIYHPTHHRYLPFIRARRMVVTLHDCTQEKFPQEFRYNDRVLRYRKALFARADAIICISEASRRDLLRFYHVDPARTRVIHHGVNRLTPSLKETPRGFQSVRPYLLYVGSRAHYKNFRSLLHAFRDAGLYRDLDLLLVGGGPLTSADSRLIAELGLTHAVVQLERATDDVLAEAYSSARLFVYPSLSEGFGLPPLEAMHLGCPALVCNTSCLPEICGDAPFYFEPNSPESLTEALRSAACDDTARARAVERGYKVASQYSWEKCAAETLALYRECL